MNDDAPGTRDAERLPVWGTVRRAFGFVFGNFALLVRVGLTPLLLSVVIALALVEAMPPVETMSPGGAPEETSGQVR